MPRRTHRGAMHVATVRRHYKGKEYVTYLLRHSYREGSKVKNQTLANLSYLPDPVIDVIRRALRGEALVGVGERFVIERVLPHGHVAAVATAAHQLGLPDLLGHDCRERALALGLVVAKVCQPGPLPAARWWTDTTLACDWGLADASVQDVFAAVEWLVDHQHQIERRLANRHLASGIPGYLHMSSGLEGRTAPGYSRDSSRPPRARIRLGVVVDAGGSPLAVEAFDAELGDPKAFASAVDEVRGRLGLSSVVLVGDGFSISGGRMRALSARGIGWIIAPRTPTVAALIQQSRMKLSALVAGGVAVLSHPDYPGERFVLYRRPAQAPGTIRALMEGTLEPGRRNQGDVGTGEDGVCILRTSVSAEVLDAAEVVAVYTNLGWLEQDFPSPSMGGFRPLLASERLGHHVRSDAVVCMLAAHVACYLRRIWSPILGDQDDGLGILLGHLATLTRAHIRFVGSHLTLDKLSEATPTQRRSFELLDAPLPLTVASSV